MSFKYALLGLLSLKPSTGYDLKKVFEESSSMYWSGNNNQIYKTLIQLQADELVTSHTEHQEGLPSKKIYSITPDGMDELKEWAASAPEAPEFKKPFLIQLAWAELLSNQELHAILTQYESEIKVRLLLQQEKIRRGNGAPDRTPRETFLWEMIDENILSSYKNELNWVQKVRSELFKKEWDEERAKMNYKVIEKENKRYIELISCEAPINTEQDALDLIGLCGGHDTCLLMLHSQVLSDNFFRLKTGVAGAVLQKFTNYQIKVVAVVPEERVSVGKFKDMMIETNRGNQFRIYWDRAEAEKWLIT